MPQTLRQAIRTYDKSGRNGFSFCRNRIDGLLYNLRFPSQY